eukprot:TRINITY_DN833_c0_g2_i4.p1 TRINITY_DN833_c0_g2~~TRINITY_DN833_c0_g2_i4.p1  ORF type:complete len:332 (+),score=69.02 TRINITY_DN833_c0_g2_i4:53-1048(+)
MSETTAAVEVERNVGCFFRAVVQGVDHEHFIVKYDESSATERVHHSKVRTVAPTTLATDFAVTIGEYVEVRTVISADEPTCWREGLVKAVKKDLILVKFDSKEESIESSRLRPAYSRLKLLSAPEIFCRTLTVPAELCKALTDREKITSVQAKTRAFVTFDEKSRKLTVVGTEESVDSACLALNLHVRHQSKILEMQAERDRLQMFEGQTAIASALKHYSHHKVVRVDQSLLGFVIGKKGANIQTAHDIGAKVIIEEDTKDVYVFANDGAILKKAVEIVEIVERHIPVTTEQKGWIIGKRGSMVQEIIDTAEVKAIELEGDNVVVIGRKVK